MVTWTGSMQSGTDTASSALLYRIVPVEIIDAVIRRIGSMGARQVSEYSHGDVPWLTTPDGEEISYESVFYRTPAYSVRDDDGGDDRVSGDEDSAGTGDGGDAVRRSKKTT